MISTTDNDILSFCPVYCLRLTFCPPQLYRTLLICIPRSTHGHSSPGWAHRSSPPPLGSRATSHRLRRLPDAPLHTSSEPTDHGPLFGGTCMTTNEREPRTSCSWPQPPFFITGMPSPPTAGTLGAAVSLSRRSVSRAVPPGIRNVQTDWMRDG